MARRNLASREDIEPDELRQRRDLYVIAIALIIFNVAGGSIADQVSVSGLLPVKLRYPGVLVVTAWVGFIYFWWRFWLISEVKPFRQFWEDVQWQAGTRRAVRDLAAKFVDQSGRQEQVQERRTRILSPTGPVVKFQRVEGKTLLNLQMVKSRRNANSSVMIGPANIEVDSDEQKIIHREFAVAVFIAMTHERTFSDYTMPHLIAVITVLVGLARLVM